MFSISGEKYAFYSNNPNVFGDVRDTRFRGMDDTLPFEKVGTGIGFYLGNSRQYLVFDNTGTKYSISTEFGEPLGPFEL